MDQRGENRELRAKLLETRQVMNEKVEAARAENSELRAKLLETRQMMNEKVEAARAENSELRAKLLETRQVMNEKVQAARAENSELRRQLALYERRGAMQNVDARAHNQESGMDEFFSGENDPEPYVRFGAALRAQLQKLGIALDHRSIADAGVGPAFALKEVLRGSRPREVFGFDFSSKALELARREIPEAFFEQRDIYDVPKRRFDVVLCTEVLEHLERPSEALEQLVNMLGEGGVLVLTVPDGRIDFSEKHINFWSPEGWRLFLLQTLPGFQIQTSIFKPYPETVHQSNLGIVSKPK